jgi:glycosyltransferase involved in cell wall biosynthesis
MTIQKVSIVIPIYNEADNINQLSKEIESAFLNNPIEYEVIWVDDCSLDGSKNVLLQLNKNTNKVISHTQNRGQSAALMTGISAASNEIIATIDGDLQNDPLDLPPLLRKLEEGYDVVCGRRRGRKDKKLRTFLSGFANRIARFITKVNVTDLGCTLRVFRKSVMNDLEIIGEMHRVFVVYLFLNGARITEMDVVHRPRIYGVSKYGYNRVLKFTMDILFAVFYSKFRYRPLYYFGSISLGVFSTGTTVQLIAIYLRVSDIKPYLDATLITGGLILQVSSFTFLSIGLVAEILVRMQTKR